MATEDVMANIVNKDDVFYIANLAKLPYWTGECREIYRRI